MKNQIIIGTRGSKLALWQADYIEQRLREEYPGLSVMQKRVTTKGDRILDVPLAKIGGKGLFTKELEEEMLSGGIDLAVHSLKDMPAKVPDGLVIAAVTKRLDPGDALVSNRFSSFEELPKGARVGTSSLRRRAQLLCARPDLEMLDLRGNVNTRLRKLDEGEYDAIVLAVAGLKRLGFADRIRQVLPREMVLPAVGQGALAIETRADDKETRDMLAFLRDYNDSKSVMEVFCGLYERLSADTFRKIFVVCLADNGSEFSNPSAIEMDGSGQARTRVFYCEPSAPYQKGSAERNHEFIRLFIPKGTDMAPYTQEDISLMMDHINSYGRAGLGDRSPYDMFAFLYGEEVLRFLGCRRIPPQDITLGPSVFRKEKRDEV